ncbi:hypothetical protein GQR58_021977 [Nymphon striatum]|nr:hypothetical protein GQR58_021977 [Nymphon striatum]
MLRNRKINPKSDLRSAIGVNHKNIRQLAQGSMGGSFNTREYFHGKTPSFVNSMKYTFLILAFLVPLVLLVISLNNPAYLILLVAVAAQYLGLIAERWYFFADANHPQNFFVIRETEKRIKRFKCYLARFGKLMNSKNHTDSAPTSIIKVSSLMQGSKKEASKQTWLKARVPYGQTEVFRFGNVNVDDWEGKVNAWPLDEGLIDYVDNDYEHEDGNKFANANIIAGKEKIDIALLESFHEKGGSEANVATGYHAIEFLLWGQDLNEDPKSAGKRAYTDFVKVKDLQEIVADWQPNQDNYRKAFMALDENEALRRMLFGMGSLSLGELAGERINVALLAHSQEDEHSCFSDNTHIDISENARGIKNIFTGSYTRTDGTIIKGASLSQLVAVKDSKLAMNLEDKFQSTEKSIDLLVKAAANGEHFDQQIASSNKTGNMRVKAVINALRSQTVDIESVSKALGIKNLNPENSDSFSEGVKAEGKATLSYKEHEVVFKDGKTYSLQTPVLAFKDLNYGELSKDVLTSVRTAPVMIGLGLLEAIKEEDIYALADENDDNNDGISGRPNKVWDVKRQQTVLGRFGWKANQPNIEQQSAGAFLGDMGITSDLFPKQNCTSKQVDCSKAAHGGSPEISAEILDKVVFYASTLAVPARRNSSDPEVLKGEKLFKKVGCDSCHTTTFKTGELEGFPELSNQTIHPYTDLLLHDMGEGLSDNRPDFEATGRRMEDSTSVGQWQHYGEQFAIAGNNSLFFNEADEAKEVFVNKLYQASQKISLKNLRVPIYGKKDAKGVTHAAPYKLEAWRSGQSLAQVRAGVTSIQSILEQGKVLDWLEKNKSWSTGRTVQEHFRNIQ